MCLKYIQTFKQMMLNIKPNVAAVLMLPVGVRRNQIALADWCHIWFLRTHMYAVKGWADTFWWVNVSNPPLQISSYLTFHNLRDRWEALLIFMYICVTGQRIGEEKGCKPKSGRKTRDLKRKGFRSFFSPRLISVLNKCCLSGQFRQINKI